MNKEDYFDYSIKNKLYITKDWLINAFSVTDDVDLKNINMKEGAIVRISGVANVVINNKLEKLVGSTNKEPIYTFKDPIIAFPEMCENLSEKIKTTRGRLLFNLMVLVNSFGKKIPYANEQISIDDIEKNIMPLLKDTPENDSDRHENFIYVDEYKKFVNSLFYLTNFTQLLVWGLTEKLILPPPNIDKVRKELLLKYKGKLEDPVVLAEFEKDLKKLDNDYLKDDPGGQYFQYNSKARNIVRKKLFLTYGSEKGLLEERLRHPLVDSLNDGWKVADMPTMINDLRAGSYNRGSETQLGGELTKWLFRASTGLEIGEQDCGTNLGLEVIVTEKNYKKLVNLYLIAPKGVLLIDSLLTAKGLIGKTVNIRSPLFCHTKDNNYCEICLGKDMANNKDGISLAIAEIGSMFLLMKMKAMHGKALSAVNIDLNLSLS